MSTKEPTKSAKKSLWEKRLRCASDRLTELLGMTEDEEDITALETARSIVDRLIRMCGHA